MRTTMARLRASQRREQLLDAAARVFSERGYARATISELARAAEVTDAIIYRHFKSKRDLFIALIEQTGRETIDRWRERLSDASSPRDRLRRLLDENPIVREEGRLRYAVILQAISEIEDEAIHRALDDHIRALHGFVRHELEEALEAGQVRNGFSAELIGWALVHLGVGYGALSTMRIDGHGKDLAGHHVVEVLASVLLDG